MAFRRTDGTQIRATPAASDHFWAEAFTNENRYHPFHSSQLKRSKAPPLNAAKSVYRESFYSNDIENYRSKVNGANCIYAAGKRSTFDPAAYSSLRETH